MTKIYRANFKLISYLEGKYGISPLELGDEYTVHTRTDNFYSIWVDYGPEAGIGKFIVDKDVLDV